MRAVISDGLSETSRQQLVGRTGEDIVDADIASQMSGSGSALFGIFERKPIFDVTKVFEGMFTKVLTLK